MVGNGVARLDARTIYVIVSPEGGLALE